MMSILLGTVLAVHACPAIKAHFLLHLQANLLEESETEAAFREFLSSHFCCCQYEPFLVYHIFLQYMLGMLLPWTGFFRKWLALHLSELLLLTDLKVNDVK